MFDLHRRGRMEAMLAWLGIEDESQQVRLINRVESILQLEKETAHEFLQDRKTDEERESLELEEVG